MIMNLNEEERIKINKLLSGDENNRMVSDFYYEVLNNSLDISENYIKDISFYDNLLNYFEVSEDYAELFHQYKVNENFKELDNEEYSDNPYYKNIKVKNIKEGNCRFETFAYKAYEPVLYAGNYLDKGIEITPVGYFKKDFEYPALLENNDIWMLITPHEMNTMQKSIHEAKGNVAVFGLGLGYYAYMVSLKEEVKSITIIEKDKKIIDLFKKHILQQFENKNKIKIVTADAFDFVKKNRSVYNYAFVDLWRDADDGIPLYIQMLKAAKKWSNTYFSYWIESSMLMMVRRCLLSYLKEAFSKEKCNYDQEENYYDHLINGFYKALKDYPVNSAEDILSLLNISNLKKFIMANF